jgi:hypothetical protein
MLKNFFGSKPIYFGNFTDLPWNRFILADFDYDTSGWLVGREFDSNHGNLYRNC